MAGELKAPISITGLTLYGRVFNAASQVWAGAAFAALSGGSFSASTKPALTDAEGSGVYVGSAPSGSIAAGAIRYEVRSGAGVATDPVVWEDFLAGIVATTADLPFAFSGAYAVTITVDDGSDPLNAALVRVDDGTDSQLLQTGSDGIASFSLDAADYTVAITKGGYSFTPATLSASAATSQTYSMTATAIDLPDSPDQATAYIVMEAEGVAIEYRLATTPTGDGSGFNRNTQTSPASAAGTYLIEFPLYKGQEYQFRFGSGKWVTATVPDDEDTFAIPNLGSGMAP